MKQPKEILKSYFETGDKPTEKEFCDLIDSYHHQDSGVIVTNVKEDADGNTTVSLSDGTSITIDDPENNNDQDNTIRTIDLGDIKVSNTDSELDINQAVADKFNVLPETIRTIAETENIILIANIREVILES